MIRTDQAKRWHMTDAPRITPEEVRRRMENGEQFTFLDVRNPQAWADADVMAPKAIRVRMDQFEENPPAISQNKPIVTYCT